MPIEDVIMIIQILKRRVSGRECIALDFAIDIIKESNPESTLGSYGYKCPECEEEIPTNELGFRPKDMQTCPNCDHYLGWINEEDK